MKKFIFLILIIKFFHNIFCENEKIPNLLDIEINKKK
jgi:hypothetical protein